jgi:hypothetical protein
MDDGSTALIVFLLGAPQILERAERCQNGASNPDGVFALGRGDNFDLNPLKKSNMYEKETRDVSYLHGGRSKRVELFLHTVCDAREHSSATGEDDIPVQFTTNIDIAGDDRVVRHLVDT